MSEVPLYTLQDALSPTRAFFYQGMRLVMHNMHKITMSIDARDRGGGGGERGRAREREAPG